jgi:probable F420-dependent oxidoreductase
MFGVALPGRGPLAKPDLILRIAERADALRFDSVFVTDHVVLPVSAARSRYPYAESGQFPGGMDQDYLEPLTLLGYLAHATRRVRLGTSVLVIPYRNPVATAKMLASLDVISGGRIVLGAGVGWLQEEFEALGAPPFAERGRVTDEYLRIMRACWTKSPASFQGRYYSFREVYVLPRPRQASGIPVWIGGHTDAALRRAAELGDGWHPIGLRAPARLEPAEYATKVKQLHAYARGAGRDPAAITQSFRAPMQVLANRARPALGGPRPPFQGTAAQVAADLREYQALGVSHFVFDPVTPDPKAVLTNLERFAHDVRPKLASRRR